MAFKDGYRLEKVYFENIYTLLNTLKSMKGTEADFDTVRELLDNAIADNESIILIYKNLGELYNEVAIRFTELDKQLKDLRTNLDEWKDEINEKIDEVNNYIMNFIREILERLDVIEADLTQMGRVLTYDIERVNNEWEMKEQNTSVTFEKTASYFTHERPHLVLVRGELNDEVTYLFPREYDTTENTGLFEWYSMGFVGNEIHEITVTLLPDDSVNVAINTTDFAGILQRLTTAETNITDLQGRMTNAETDIDTLEQTAESHNDRISDLETCCDDVETALDGKQDTLVAGSGISIDPTTNEITNTAQGATYTAGNGIEINNDIISNIQGCLNLGQLTQILNIKSTPFSNYNNALVAYLSSPVSNYKGIFYSMVFETIFDDLFIRALESFESDFEIEERGIILLGTQGNLSSDSSGIIYHRDYISQTIKCENGTVQKDYNTTPNSHWFLRKGKMKYVPFGKHNGTFYIHLIKMILLKKTAKTTLEWFNFLTNQPASEIFNNFIVYGTEF